MAVFDKDLGVLREDVLDGKRKRWKGEKGTYGVVPG